ncbi:MAG: hypothetical protein ABW101_14175 [Candidatus Thiodiazotropha sp.]
MHLTGSGCRLIGYALLALLMGISLYLFTRDTHGVAFLNLLPSAFRPDHPVSCPFCGSLPTLLHAYAFILLSAVVLRPATRRSLLGLSLFWLTLECLFEFGQLDGPARQIDQLLVDLGDGSDSYAWIGRFFLTGTFDPWDLLGAGVGAAGAYLTLASGTTEEVRNAQPDYPETTSD